MTNSKEKFLVTGAMGCIGAWVLHNLVAQGVDVVATDLTTDIGRPGLLLDQASLQSIHWRSLDVTDSDAVHDLIAREQPTSVVHLAGLQIPFCRNNPVAGAAVNVVGTVNVFEAVRKQAIKGLCYASSLAVLGPVDHYPPGAIGDDALPYPGTLYGVYKTANENTARIYWQDWQVGSVGLRPYTVYGVARDQGMTADLAKAVLAVAAGKPFHIRFSGPVTLQHASDVADIFIASARAEHAGAAVCNLRNDVIDVADFVATLERMYPQSAITFETDAPLPFPADLDDAGLHTLLGSVSHTPLEQAIEQDMQRFGKLLAENRVDLAQLDA